MNELTKTESIRLDKLKIEINTWIEDRFKVGEALAEIRDSKLYRRDYETFEDFCKAEFKWGRDNAYKLITAAETKKSLPENVENFIQNAAQANAVARIPLDQREEVLKKAATNGHLTASRITQAAKESKTIFLDKTGWPIPELLNEDWKRAEDMSDLLSKISQVKSVVESGLEEPDFIFAEIKNDSVAMLKNIYSNLKRLIPYAVCPSCQGHKRKTCALCGKRGFLSKFNWDTCIPEETKQIRMKAIKK